MTSHQTQISVDADNKSQVRLSNVMLFFLRENIDIFQIFQENCVICLSNIIKGPKKVDTMALIGLKNAAKKRKLQKKDKYKDATSLLLRSHGLNEEPYYYRESKSSTDPKLRKY